jgi:hypothetical protein
MIDTLSVGAARVSLTPRCRAANRYPVGPASAGRALILLKDDAVNVPVLSRLKPVLRKTAFIQRLMFRLTSVPEHREAAMAAPQARRLANELAPTGIAAFSENSKNKNGGHHG